jgi:hypothetical protein
LTASQPQTEGYVPILHDLETRFETSHQLLVGTQHNMFGCSWTGFLRGAFFAPNPTPRQTQTMTPPPDFLLHSKQNIYNHGQRTIPRLRTKSKEEKHQEKA